MPHDVCSLLHPFFQSGIFSITVKPEPQKGRTDQQIRDGIGPDRNADKNDRPKRQPQKFADFIKHQSIT